MIGTTGLLRFACIAAFLTASSWAQDSPSWDNRLAETFSGRWKEIQNELYSLATKLDKLPGIPIDDQGGTGGFACTHTTAEPPDEAGFAVEILWKEPREIDLVALVPARRYNAKGLDAQYGLPEAFSASLIDEHGTVLRQIAIEPRTKSNPARNGHPFVYQVSPPVMAAGLRISAMRLMPDDEEENKFVHAWAEVMAFSENRNVALGGEVRNIGGNVPSAPWSWNNPFLVDGQTPLGLPEFPDKTHGNIGWMSEGRTRPEEAASLSVDLGSESRIDSVRLLPAKKPTSDLPSGFGFPRKFSISTSPSGAAGSWTTAVERELGNPGHNPVLVTFPPVQARYVRVDATVLWKAFDDYPAFFALSEVEVLSGESNLATGKGIQSPDGMMNLIAPGGRFWSAGALSDGFGPDGRLVPVRQWMIALDERLRLETRRHMLSAEAGRVVEGWRNVGLTGLIALSLAAAFLIVFLPIRYRIQANRELVKVRERIAGDLHDEVGSNLGSIQMIADLAEGRSGPSAELKRIQRIAAETVSAVRDIVWLLRPTGDHRIGTVEHLRETSSIMLETLEWKFTANEEAWQVELPEEMNRDLFLYFRESLHNIMRHAKATTVEIRAEKTENAFRLMIADNGVGIAPERLERPATLRALRQRATALNGELGIDSAPDNGTRLTLTVPLLKKRKR